MTENTPTVRKVLYYTMIVGCWAHLAAYMFMSMTFAPRTTVLGLGALVIMSLCYVLDNTKRTLPIEQHLPTWFYTLGVWSWGVGALLWFFVVPLFVDVTTAPAG
jgi:hypothetical protein